MSEDILGREATASDSGQRRVGILQGFARTLRMSLVAGVFVLGAAALMPLFHPLWPMASVTEHFAVQILIGAVLLAILALALRRWRWLVPVIAIALIQLWIMHPYWPRLAGEAAAATSGDFKVVSLNVWYRGESYAAVRDYLASSDADVIGLVEVTPRWKEELAPLRAIYPYGIDCIGADPRCEEMLLSRHPFARSGAARIDGKLPVLAWGEIALPGRGPLTIAVTHLVWPLLPLGGIHTGVAPRGLPQLVQAQQADSLAGGLPAPGSDFILMGDFNAAPWSRIQQDFRAASGLDNQGFVAPSWPSWAPGFARLPIDHVMVRGDLRLVSFHPGPDVGSDHLPVEAVVSLAAR